MKEAAPQESRAQRDASAQRAWESARRAMQLALPGLLRRAGVVGVDLGLKRSAGQLLPGPSICIHVERKIPDEELHPRRRLPSRIGRFPVDVVESRFRAGAACPSSGAGHRARVDPVVGGCSIGRFGKTEFGTLGFVAENTAGQRGGVTCAHVCTSGNQVRQPHRVGRAVGRVTVAVRDRTIDAAFVPFEAVIASEPSVLGVGPVDAQALDVGGSALPLPVLLVGACSGHSAGLIVSTDFNGTIEYPDGARFVSGQMRIESAAPTVFARGGDSGSAVLHGRQVVAMLIAANQPELGGTGIATPIRRVLGQLNVSLP